MENEIDLRTGLWTLRIPNALGDAVPFVGNDLESLHTVFGDPAFDKPTSRWVNT
jgi:hypothetical protein